MCTTYDILDTTLTIKWHVVLSTSGGFGWDIQADSHWSVSISGYLRMMTSDLQVLTTMNFTKANR